MADLVVSNSALDLDRSFHVWTVQSQDGGRIRAGMVAHPHTQKKWPA